MPLSLSKPLSHTRSAGLRDCARGGFTLIELLVVISIIAVLAGMLTPALSRGKRSAQSAACMSHLHQMGLALEMYVQDNEHRLPCCSQIPSATTNAPTIMDALHPYLGAPEVFHCPADRNFFPKERTSYEWNAFLNGASYDRPEEWSAVTRSIVETVFGGRRHTPLLGDAAAFHPQHGELTGKNALYFDGRVERTRTKAAR